MGTGPVLDRTISSVGSTTRDVVHASFVWSMASASSRVAAAPASAHGIRTVVRAGVTCAAIQMSSTPTTLTSAPTRTPRSVSRRTTPSAIWSLKASTAVAPSAITRSAARTPDSKLGENGPTTDSARPARAHDASTFRRRSRLVNIVVGAAST